MCFFFTKVEKIGTILCRWTQIFFFAFPEEILALHLALETGDVSVAEILAELLHLLQLQQVNPQHLDRSDHLKKEGALLGDSHSASCP
jgi:hypothetical protein